MPIAGCRATAEEWATIETPAIVTGGVDPIHPTQAAQDLHRLLRKCRYHDPVVTAEDWSGLFNVVPGGREAASQ